MNWTYWGLRQAPFRETANAELLSQSPVHEEALARLHFLVENRRRIGLVLGHGGTGKTLLLNQLARELRAQGVTTVVVSCNGADTAHLLHSLANGMGLNVPHNVGLASLWGRLADRIAERRYQQLQTVLLLDDAECGPQDLHTTAVRWLRLDTALDPLHTLVLSARTQGVAALGAELLEAVDLRVDLDPWTVEETRQYIQHSLARAGGATSLFEESALYRLHELSGGTPRRVVQIADLALVAAAGQELQTIDPRTIENVHRELTLPMSYTSAPA